MSQPLLYSIWFKLYRSKHGVKINWLDRNTTIFFDGYPRSGNTFMYFLFGKIYDIDIIAHHYHAIAPLKIALKKRIKSIIIIREPIEAIASNYLKRFELIGLPKKINYPVLKRLIIDYKNYYKFINRNKDKVFLVHFNSLINNPENTIFQIDLFLENLSGLEESVLKKRINEVKDLSFGSKSVLGSSKPNQEKSILKKEIKRVIKNIQEYEECKKAYFELSKNHITK